MFTEGASSNCQFGYERAYDSGQCQPNMVVPERKQHVGVLW
jgi:hypothetical protein